MKQQANKSVTYFVRASRHVVVVRLHLLLNFVIYLSFYIFKTLVVYVTQAHSDFCFNRAILTWFGLKLYSSNKSIDRFTSSLYQLKGCKTFKHNVLSRCTISFKLTSRFSTTVLQLTFTCVQLLRGNWRHSNDLLLRLCAFIFMTSTSSKSPSLTGHSQELFLMCAKHCDLKAKLQHVIHGDMQKSVESNMPGKEYML